MSVHLYTRCWNDGAMLPFFFRHYDPWVDRYVVYDDGSTDGSLDLLNGHAKVEVRPMPPPADPTSRVESHRRLQNEFWKESRGAADWVVVTDIDEHLDHPDMAAYLAACRRAGVTLLPALGFRMVARDFPPADATLAEAVPMGMPHRHESKLGIFDPAALAETNFAVGRHDAAPQGRLVLPMRDEIRLLHFHWVGYERVAARHRLFRSRQRAGDIARRWGAHYDLDEAAFERDWRAAENGAVDARAMPLAAHPGRKLKARAARVAVGPDGGGGGLVGALRRLFPPYRR
ncbi:glycosyltransferase family 2 protein [Prosthecomicrobium pneumaticum]|uniref:Glycosyl transferase family 2 n=1 Tax=Prosthecomicrobium pneumaticum TaxID=81895 RepID=A0A7W9FN19_9HYPH|nr:glycosyltransferase family 2 protein [Prosthecomicrobium pneumaticum]MBB5753730.1 hypothetical protein [Prosthecomicrobium pneumaticum]